MSIKTTTEDARANLAILPDWNKRVSFSQIFDSNTTLSFSGKEQRSAKKVRPDYRLEYFQSGLTPLETRRRLQEIRSEFDGPLVVPIWPDGVLLDGDMTLPVGDDTASLATNLPLGYETPFSVYIWNPTDGGEFRTVTNVEDLEITLDGSSTLYPDGSFLFPCLPAIREVDAETLNSIDAEAGIERIRFLTL